MNALFVTPEGFTTMVASLEKVIAHLNHAGPPVTLLLNFWVVLRKEAHLSQKISTLLCSCKCKYFIWKCNYCKCGLICEILRFILTNQGLYLNLSTS